MRLFTMLAVVAAGLVLTATGCGGNSSRLSYSARDLPGIVDAKPRLPKWPFSPFPAHDPAVTLREVLGDSPTSALRAFAAKLKKDGFVIGRELRWNGEQHQPAGGGADSDVVAYLFRTASGAGAFFRAVLPSLHREGEKVISSKGLGDESAAERVPDGVYSVSESAGYAWRRANLVILAELACPGRCLFNVVPPARTYADEIDARAKRKA